MLSPFPMRFPAAVLFCICACVSGFGAREIQQGPAPDWVIRFPDDAVRPRPDAATAGLDTDYLLVDRQEHVAAEEDYFRVAQRVITEGGLDSAGEWSVTYDPEYEAVTLHRLTVIRDGQPLDRMPDLKLRYLEQEPDAAMHLYNHQVTALALLPDVRVGDIIDAAYTRRGRNPVFAGHYMARFSLGWYQQVAQVRTRVVAPESLRLDWALVGANVVDPVIQLRDDQRIYEWRLESVPQRIYEAATPDWYPTYPFAEFTDFADWAGVVEWALPLYAAKDAPLDEALAAAVAPIRADTKDPRQLIANLLEFVQRNIRYVGVELGVSSHQPHPPAETFAQRFGDCKDKTLLLVQLLRAAGFEAHPVLVHSSKGLGLPGRLPSASLFDHVITGVRLEGEWIWLDPTMAPQAGDLAQRGAPDYRYGLVVAPGETGLRRMDPPASSQSRIVVHESYVSPDWERPADFRAESRYYGPLAVSMASYLESTSAEQVTQTYQEYYASSYPNMKALELVSWQRADDGAVVVVEHFAINDFWKPDADSGDRVMETYPLLLNEYLPRGLSIDRRAPRAVKYPMRVEFTQRLQLPGPWDVHWTPAEVSDDAFDFSFSGAGGDEEPIELKFVYAAKAPQVEPAGMADYAANVGAARDELGHVFTHYGMSSDAAEPEASTVAPAAADGAATFHLNLLMVVVAVGTVVVAALFFAWLVRHWGQRPPPLPVGNGQPSGLGGWLVLPMLGMVLAPITFSIGLTHQMRFSFDHQVWSNLTTVGSAAYDPGRAVLILAEVVVVMSLLVGSIYGVVLFFRRHRVLPLFFSVFLLANWLYLVGNFAACQLFPDLAGTDGLMDIFTQTVRMAVWIPYFRVSHRVKNTFVR